MTNDDAISTNETVMKDTQQIAADLRAGLITNSIARTLLAANRDVLNGLKIGIMAKSLGSSIDAVHLYDEQRKAAEAERVRPKH